MHRLLLVGAVCALCSVAVADAVDDFLPRLVSAARSELATSVAKHEPTLVPPSPVQVAWKPVRLGSVDLGAPLIAMASADLDKDGKAELFAVTSNEVIALSIDKKVKILARVAYSGEPSAQMPRDLFGTAAVDGSELVAKCSGWASELRVSWKGKALAGVVSDASRGALVCPGERLLPVPGRNHFGEVDKPIYDVRCAELVDKEGRPLHVRAQLTPQKLSVTAGTQTFELGDYGVAFAIGDVDRDGVPELVVTGAGAPGDPDAVKVLTLGGDEKKGLFRKVFQGGVAGVAVTDGDGDGITEVIAAVRLVGASRADIWRLD